MRFVSFGPRDRERPGILIDGRIVDLMEALEWFGGRLPMLTLSTFFELSNWWTLAESISQVTNRDLPFVSDDVRIGAPVPVPKNVFVVGANTHSHIAEARRHTDGLAPRAPMILAKSASTVAGPRDYIVKPRETNKLDYETELGVVIAKRGRRVSYDDALSIVGGYMVVNDVSARDVQLAEGESNPFYRTHYLGKSFDTFCPCGPCLVTPDEIPPLGDLRINTWVNGELRQDAPLSDLVFDVASLVAYISNTVTLSPGDVICTGSPAGVAAFREPPAYLQPGDVVESEILPIGRLTNRVIGDHES